MSECKRNKELLDENVLILRILDRFREYKNRGFNPLINGTDVIIHTSLDRSIFDEELFKSRQRSLCFYTSLEFNLKSGRGGPRYDAVLERLRILFGCEDVLIVNNNATTVFLVLNSLTFGKGVLNSEGKFVEIGGNSRIPKVIKATGVRLEELGTSNKIHPKDYENAVTKGTEPILKARKSNFTLKDSYEEVSTKDLGTLAKKKRLIGYYDPGSGWCGRLPRNLNIDEPEIKRPAGQCNLLSSSADKLSSSMRADIIFGKKRPIAKLRQNQLLRILRIDKLSLIFLSKNLRTHLQKNYDRTPTLRLLNGDLTYIKAKVLRVQKELDFESLLKPSKNLVGGGSLPNKCLRDFVLASRGGALKMQEDLRKQGVIMRIEDKDLVLDFRDIQGSKLEELIELTNKMENLR